MAARRKPPTPCASEHAWGTWYSMRDGTGRYWRVCSACGLRDVNNAQIATSKRVTIDQD
jgi:hypothetical protein